MFSLGDKSMVVIGGSRGVGRRVVEAGIRNGARVLAVARQEGPLRRLAQEISGTEVLALDATEEGARSKVFDVLQPDILVLCGGAFPPAAPLHEQTWQEFAVNWETDVKIAFHFFEAALAASACRRLGCTDLQWRGSGRLAAFGRPCRSQTHPDIHGKLQSEGIGSSWARTAIPSTCAAHHARRRSRKACGRGLFPLSWYVRR